MAVHITPATAADIPTIRALAHATWPATFGDILSPGQIAYMLDLMYSAESLETQMTARGHRFLVARADGEPVGYASYEVGYQAPDVAKLHKLYVRPDQQGLGVGLALITAVRQAAAQGGQRTLTLNVNRHNRAIQFYERQGFTVAGEEDIDIGNGFYMNDVIMTLRLERHPASPPMP